MKTMKLLLVLAGALTISAPTPAATQEPSGSPIADLLRKGREELNQFNYRVADTVAHQLLALPNLSRQQRIDALQLLAAVLYPDDPPEQRRDSASKIIRELVQMGVPRMLERTITWPGLEQLYESVAAEAGPVTASGAPARGAAFDSLRHVMALVAEGRPMENIVDRVNVDCYTFSFEELTQALRRVRGPIALPDALKRRCSRLLVETDPPNANLVVGTRQLGTVPERGQLLWALPEEDVRVAVASGSDTAGTVVDLPQGKLLQARFFLPKDTLLWPSVRTPEEIAQELRLFEGFTPSTSRPAQPVRPHGMNAMGFGFIWGLLGGAAGYAVAQFVPAATCTVNKTVPQNETWKVRGQRYAAGESVNLGGGLPCVGAVAGGSFLGSTLFMATIKTSKNRGAMSRYNEAVRNYPTVVQDWETRERRAFAERNPDVRQALADQQTRIAQVRADNGSIRARNSNLPQPQVFIRELGYAETVGAAAPATDMSSDVDLRAPLAATPNPDAVAIVLGNRDYETRGVPRVEYASRDARSVKRYLVETFGFSEDRVILDTNATAARMSELFGSATDASVSRLAELVAARPAGSVDVFVFYSGHAGSEEQRRFLIPVDANPRRLRATGYSLDVLYKNLTALKARSVTVAIDAGFSGVSDGGSILSNESFSGRLEVEVGTVGGANVQVFLATTGTETAKWRRDQGHGLFTYFFLRGLQGAADTDANNAVTSAELDRYVKANVTTYARERLSGALQQPEVTTNNPDRVLVSFKSGN